MKLHDVLFAELETKLIPPWLVTWFPVPAVNVPALEPVESRIPSSNPPDDGMLTLTATAVVEPAV